MLLPSKLSTWLRRPGVARGLIAAVALAFAVSQVAAVFRESVNWDEFVLLQRAELTLGTGDLHGGGRPGLGVLALTPFVHDCTDSIETVRAARVAWVAITLALIGGLFAFLYAALHRTAERWHAAALGAALLCLVPIFARWSLQIRTDQPAIACALWSGVALFASRRRPRWALLSGMLLGVGYLFSQKAIYIGALVVLVAVGDLFIDGRVSLRREALRLGGALAGALATVAVFYLVVPTFFGTPPTVTVARGLEHFRWYREAVGFGVYRAMLPTLIPHLVCLALILAATIRAAREDSPHKRPLLIALATAVLGIAVGRFHTAAFPYFWMTLGVFFATAIALGWDGICALIPRGHAVLAVVLWAALLYGAVAARLETLADTQAVQRDTLSFIDRNFERTQRGFHTHGLMFCRRDPDPIPALLVSTIEAHFYGPDGRRFTAAFVDEFRKRPITIVATPNQIGPFPPAVTELWDASYVPYYRSVRIPGRQFGKPVSDVPLQLLVTGRYRWFTEPNASSTRITIDGKQLQRGDTIELPAGSHTVTVDGPGGMLAFDVRDPPLTSSIPFYTTADDLLWWEARERARPPKPWSRERSAR